MYDEYKKKSKYILNNEYIFIIISFIILSILSSFLLLFAGKLHGNDIIFNIKRIVELKFDIIHYHNFFPFSLNTDHGAAVLDAYPSLNLLPIVFVNTLGISLKNSILFAFMINIFITLMVSFFSSLKFSRSIQLSYIFSILYATSYVFIVNNFLSMDLGVANTYVYLPLVIFGFLNLLHGYINHYLELAIGISLIVLSHLPSAIIIFVFLLTWLFINIKNININIVISFIKSITIVVCLTSIFWIPFFRLVFTNKIDTPTSSLIAPLNIKTFILNLSIWAICSIFILLFMFNKLNRYCKQMYLLSIVIIIASSKLIPYKWITSFRLLKFINKFQFTYRFLQIPQLLLIFLFSIFISNILNKFRKKSNKYYVLFLIISIIMSSNVICQLLVIHEYNQVTPVTKNVTTPLVHGHGLRIDNSHEINYLVNIPNLNDDYFPKTSNLNFTTINHNEGVYINRYGINTYMKVIHNGFNRYIFYNKKHINGAFHLPIIKYRSENMSVDLNGEKIPYYVDRNGRVTINIVKPNKNSIKLYASTQHFMLLKIIQYMLIIIGLYLIIYKYMKNRYVSKNDNNGNSRKMLI